MSPARFTIPEVESETAKNHRIAREITKATGCAILCEFHPGFSWDNEKSLPARERPSRGHVFSMKQIEPSSRDAGNTLRINASFDDLDESPAEYVAERLRNLGSRLLDMAAAVDATRWKK